MFAVFLSLALQSPMPNHGDLGRPTQKQPQSAQQPTSDDQRGTEKAPLVVKVLPIPKSTEETAQGIEDRKEKSANDRRLVLFTGLLALIGALQLIVFGYQADMLRKTVKAATGQSEDMKKTIAEASRSATAMENVAEHFDRSVAQAQESAAKFQERMAMQARAYLCLQVGHAIFQEPVRNLKFEGRPVIFNAGNTPAYRVRHASYAAILPVPLPVEFAFPIPDEPAGGALIGPHQSFAINAIVEDFVDENDVEGIKHNQGKALYVWGIISYEDVFGKDHWTKFCQQIVWLPDNNVFAIFTARHNEAD
jgi:hypothetical protein